MRTIKKNKFLYTFTTTFFLASTLCTLPAHSDTENTAKESKEALAKEIQGLRKKLKEEGSINIIIQNDIKSDVRSDSNSGSPTSPPVTPEKPIPKFKFGGTFFGSTTMQVVDRDAPLVAYGGEGGVFIFLEYKLANWFGLRSGIVKSTSNLQLLDSPQLLSMHHLTVPVTACFYPGKDRQWRLFVGPRLGKAIKVDLLSLGVIEKAAKKDLEERCFVFGDFGVEREGKNGFIIGLDGFGMRLGWNVAALF